MRSCFPETCRGIRNMISPLLSPAKKQPFDMDRKNFIKSASLLAGGAVAAPVLAGNSPLMAKPAGNALKLKKGVSFYMIKEELSLVDKCKLVKDLGFDGVEFNSPVDFSLEELVA